MIRLFDLVEDPFSSVQHSGNIYVTTKIVYVLKTTKKSTVKRQPTLPNPINFYLQDFGKTVLPLHEGFLFRLQNGDAEKQMEVFARQTSPEYLPESHHVLLVEFPFEPDEQPTETKEHVAGIVTVQIVREFRFDESEKAMQIT